MKRSRGSKRTCLSLRSSAKNVGDGPKNKRREKSPHTISHFFTHRAGKSDICKNDDENKEEPSRPSTPLSNDGCFKTSREATPQFEDFLSQPTESCRTPALNDSDMGDFQTPKLFNTRTTSVSQPSNVVAGRGKKSDKRAQSKTQRQKKVSADERIDTLLRRHNRKTDVNEDHLQLAIALSRSMHDLENPGVEIEQDERLYYPDTQERIACVKKTLEQFGFRSNRNGGKPYEINERRVEKSKRKKPLFKTNPVLFLRTPEERSRIVQRLIETVLDETSDRPVVVNSYYDSFETTIRGDVLESYYSHEAPIFRKSGLSLEEMSDVSVFYVGSLVPRSTTAAGTLLRDWNCILGREKTPPRDTEDVANIDDQRLFEVLLGNDTASERSDPKSNRNDPESEPGTSGVRRRFDRSESGTQTGLSLDTDSEDSDHRSEVLVHRDRNDCDEERQSKELFKRTKDDRVSSDNDEDVCISKENVIVIDSDSENEIREVNKAGVDLRMSMDCLRRSSDSDGEIEGENIVARSTRDTIDSDSEIKKEKRTKTDQTNIERAWNENNRSGREYKESVRKKSGTVAQQAFKVFFSKSSSTDSSESDSGIRAEDKKQTDREHIEEASKSSRKSTEREYRDSVRKNSGPVVSEDRLRSNSDSDSESEKNNEDEDREKNENVSARFKEPNEKRTRYFRSARGRERVEKDGGTAQKKIESKIKEQRETIARVNCSSGSSDSDSATGVKDRRGTGRRNVGRGPKSREESDESDRSDCDENVLDKSETVLKSGADSDDGTRQMDGDRKHERASILSEGSIGRTRSGVGECGTKSGIGAKEQFEVSLSTNRSRSNPEIGEVPRKRTRGSSRFAGSTSDESCGPELRFKKPKLVANGVFADKSVGGVPGDAVSLSGGVVSTAKRRGIDTDRDTEKESDDSIGNSSHVTQRRNRSVRTRASNRIGERDTEASGVVDGNISSTSTSHSKMSQRSRVSRTGNVEEGCRVARNRREETNIDARIPRKSTERSDGSPLSSDGRAETVPVSTEWTKRCSVVVLSSDESDTELKKTTPELTAVSTDESSDGVPGEVVSVSGRVVSGPARFASDAERKTEKENDASIVNRSHMTRTRRNVDVTLTDRSKISSGAMEARLGRPDDVETLSEDRDRIEGFPGVVSAGRRSRKHESRTGDPNETSNDGKRTGSQSVLDRSTASKHTIDSVESTESNYGIVSVRSDDIGAGTENANRIKPIKRFKYVKPNSRPIRRPVCDRFGELFEGTATAADSEPVVYGKDDVDLVRNRNTGGNDTCAVGRTRSKVPLESTGTRPSGSIVADDRRESADSTSGPEHSSGSMNRNSRSRKSHETRTSSDRSLDTRPRSNSPIDRSKSVSPDLFSDSDSESYTVHASSAQSTERNGRGGFSNRSRGVEAEIGSVTEKSMGEMHADLSTWEINLDRTGCSPDAVGPIEQARPGLPESFEVTDKTAAPRSSDDQIRSGDVLDLTQSSDGNEGSVYDLTQSSCGSDRSDSDDAAVRSRRRSEGPVNVDRSAFGLVPVRKIDAASNESTPDTQFRSESNVEVTRDSKTHDRTKESDDSLDLPEIRFGADRRSDVDVGSLNLLQLTEKYFGDTASDAPTFRKRASYVEPSNRVQSFSSNGKSKSFSDASERNAIGGLAHRSKSFSNRSDTASRKRLSFEEIRPERRSAGENDPSSLDEERSDDGTGFSRTGRPSTEQCSQSDDESVCVVSDEELNYSCSTPYRKPDSRRFLRLLGIETGDLASDENVPRREVVGTRADISLQGGRSNAENSRTGNVSDDETCPKRSGDRKFLQLLDNDMNATGNNSKDDRVDDLFDRQSKDPESRGSGVCRADGSEHGSDDPDDRDLYHFDHFYMEDDHFAYGGGARLEPEPATSAAPIENISLLLNSPLVVSNYSTPKSIGARIEIRGSGSGRSDRTLRTTDSKFDRCASDVGTPRRCVSDALRRTASETTATAAKRADVGTPESVFVSKVNDVTPMADFERMDTPSMNRELKKYGLKPLKRARGVQMLRYIYEQTHPEMENVDELKHASKCKKTRTCTDVSHARLRARYENPPTVVVTATKRKSAAGKLDKFVPAPPCRINIVGDVRSKSDTDDCLIFERTHSKKIASCRLPFHIAWHNYVTDRPDVRLQMLQYRPLQVEPIHAEFKEMGFKFHLEDIIAFLDKRCITVRTNSNSHRNRKKPS